jgi:succinate dehydrogenase hydrophobic anchor subunit
MRLPVARARAGGQAVIFAKAAPSDISIWITTDAALRLRLTDVFVMFLLVLVTTHCWQGKHTTTTDSIKAFEPQCCHTFFNAN